MPQTRRSAESEQPAPSARAATLQLLPTDELLPRFAEHIADKKAICREMHTKVGPRDGTDCVVVPGGIVQFWDDTVAPGDPTGNAPGIRLAYAYFMRWDGANADLRAFNSTSTDVPPAPGVGPVLRTADVVDLVQRLDFFTRK